MPARNPRSQDAEEATARILRHVRQVIYLSESTQREIERRLGFSRGYLSQLLGGTVELKLWQLLGILHVIGLDPSELFAQIFPRRRNSAAEALDDLLPKLRHKPLALELARLYAFGIESVTEMHERLERCETALEELADLGILRSFQRGK